ncbi:hypothetical protein LUD75_07615 [Epilithonimonas sp. JDS]|uniref:DUF6804 family protein n=1 Tax=Epilithonimonas sp. JDS TaxID=2902797 RepID=UPI001E4D898F|nr:DUF6804 family protein [Epilithonimonas sp. JDS]MCD9854569.1 hypothetical protein [Epilithonimonas sp. JDS]
MTIIKLILATLLLLCLLKMPYGYYQLVRFISFVGFGYLAFEANKNKDEKMVIAFIALALLFQPFIKIALGRFIWNIIDVVVAVFLIISILKNKKNHEKN